MMTPEPRSIMDGNRPRSSRTAGNRFSLKFCCQISSVTVINPPLGADDPPTFLNDNINTVKAIQNLVDNLGRSFGSGNVRLNEMSGSRFARRRSRRNNDRCTSPYETVGNRLAGALGAAGHQ